MVSFNKVVRVIITHIATAAEVMFSKSLQYFSSDVQSDGVTVVGIINSTIYDT